MEAELFTKMLSDKSIPDLKDFAGNPEVYRGAWLRWGCRRSSSCRTTGGGRFGTDPTICPSKWRDSGGVFFVFLTF